MYPWNKERKSKNRNKNQRNICNESLLSLKAFGWMAAHLLLIMYLIDPSTSIIHDKHFVAFESQSLTQSKLYLQLYIILYVCRNHILEISKLISHKGVSSLFFLIIIIKVVSNNVIF